MYEKMSLKGIIIAVDFDGTVVEQRYPMIGRSLPEAVRTLRWLRECGADLILWTMRSGPQLLRAIDWFHANHIGLFGVNKNPTQDSWTKSPKPYAHLYIDDAALGCPVMLDSEGKRVCVDWSRAREAIRERFQQEDRRDELVPLEQVESMEA